VFKFSQIATLEKNKLSTDAPFLMLFEIKANALGDSIRLVRNTEGIQWNGTTWTAFPVDVEPYDEDGKTLPALNLKISSGGGIITTYLQQYNGLVDAKANIYIVHAKNLTSGEPEMELDFVINETSYDEQWITFTLGPTSEMSTRFPQWRYLTDFCPFVCGDVRCGYTGSETCRNTLQTCLIKGRFGGEPGIQTGR
jgi:lambda family phage minor tail protein L